MTVLHYFALHFVYDVALASISRSRAPQLGSVYRAKPDTTAGVRVGDIYCKQLEWQRLTLGRVCPSLLRGARPEGE